MMPHTALLPQSLRPTSTVYLNGKWLPLGKATVSVLDRGFLFGDGIYEVVPVYSRMPFRWDSHLARLQRSMSEMQLKDPLGPDGWTSIVRGLIDREPSVDQFIYLQMTRGVGKRDHAFPKPTPAPTIFGMTSPLSRPAASLRMHGLTAQSMDDGRWSRCDIKSIALLGNVLAREAAVQAGFDEAVLFRDGQLTEGAASNIWVVRGDQLLAPPASGALLDGIRIGLLESLAPKAELEFVRRPITRDEVFGADELLLTSATKEILPIRLLDEEAIGNGRFTRPTSAYHRLQAAYDAEIEAHRAMAEGAPR